jgi:uncharacterized Zn-binding protein involved in type VI secretion
VRKLALIAVVAGVGAWLLRRGSTSDPQPPMQASSPVAAPPVAADGVEGYCVKERKKVQIANSEETVTKNGRNAVRGSCPDCGAKIFRFV